jgi:hypothetical protein
MKIILFILLTWGLILGLPTLLFFLLYGALGNSFGVSLLASVFLMAVFVFFGEKWSRLIGRLLKFEE